MKTTEKKSLPYAMAFYHQDGLTAAWKHAMKFAGILGRLATIPDIIASRIVTKPEETPWETYFTTLTAEYLGLSKQGNKILIVAHGIGPMSTLDGVTKAYSWQFNDKDRRREGGRITQQEFWDLESGKFGKVSVIDLDSYCRRYKYPFIQALRTSEAMTDEVLKARFGPKAEEYIKIHAKHARAWHQEQAGIDPENTYKLPNHDQFLSRRRLQHLNDGAENSDPYIVQQGPSSYPYLKMDDGLAIGHLLSIGGLCNLHHDGNESLTHDIGTYGWNDGTRIVGIQANGDTRFGIHHGPNAGKLLRKYWPDLLVSVPLPEIVGFRGLVKINDQWFTQYPKKGESMDTWEPEYVVSSMEKIGEPVQFRTTVGGYHGFFRFGTSEVKAIAPPNANAYFFVSEPQNEYNDGNPTHQTCGVQFYRVEVDASKRMMPTNRLAHDFDILMMLVRREMQEA